MRSGHHCREIYVIWTLVGRWAQRDRSLGTALAPMPAKSVADESYAPHVRLCLSGLVASVLLPLKTRSSNNATPDEWRQASTP